MGPLSRLAEFNSSDGSECSAADPHGTVPGVSRAAEGALSARRAPRPVRRRSEVSGKGGVVGLGRSRVTVPGFGGPPVNRGTASRRFRLPLGMARAPASAGRVEDGLLAVCPDCRAGRPRVRSRAEAKGQWRIGRHPVGPVLKHGPRSLTCARVVGLYETRRRNESEGRSRSVRGRIRRPRTAAHCRPVSVACRRGGARAYTLGPERW